MHTIPLLFSTTLFYFVRSLCDEGGTWTTWQLAENQNGYDYCGGVWMANWIRTCVSAPDCPCSGPDTYTAEFNTNACLFPRKACAPGKTKKMASNFLICTPTTSVPDNTVFPANYCPPSGTGVWGKWASWSSCSESCGGCGISKRTRVCTSETYGCPCTTSDIGSCQRIPCSGAPCSGSTPCCATAVLIPTWDGQRQCFPFNYAMGTGTWSEWSLTGNCNDTCGNCGVNAFTRGCLPSGYSCSGLQFYANYLPCNNNTCSSPRAECCSPYTPTVTPNGTFCVMSGDNSDL